MENLLDLTKQELEDIFKRWKFKTFRIKQVFDWVYKKFVFDFMQMNNLPKDEKDFFGENFSIINLSYIKSFESVNKESRKFLFQTNDEYFIETVLIRNKNRNTVCLSTQAGCLLNCIFCATAKMGFKRNLKASEILSQVLWISNDLKRQPNQKEKKGITNIVVMGMGEPFLNYEEVLKSLRIINNSEGYNLGARNITVSTAGIIDGIKKFMNENIQINLALSLNSAISSVREKIMPVTKFNPLPELFEILKQYQDKTGRRITFEYVLLKNVNMDENNAAVLSEKLKPFKYNLNIIKYNKINENDLNEPNPNEINNFKRYLIKYNIKFTERLSQGDDISAGCGQLGLLSLLRRSDN